jgi:cytochrome c oxidase assembly protein subunit 15
MEFSGRAQHDGFEGYLTTPRHNPTLHRVALLTTAATFPLIFMGGLVTSHGAGMSVPDWPNSYGYNMFLFPPRLWVGGILYEHTHRLAATVVGMLSIVLTAVAWKTEPRRWVRWLCTGVLGAVIFQGVLGGLRVVLVELDLAVVHACFAQAFFCLAALSAVVTSRWWLAADDRSADPGGRKLVRLAAVAVFSVYVQLILGALMRHYGAGLAIPDLPLAFGKIIPPVTGEGMRRANEWRAFDAGLPAGTTLGQVWLHFAHRVGAIVVTVHVVAAAAHALYKHRAPGLKTTAALMLALLATQVALGVFTVLKRKPADVASAHVAVGALLLVSTFVLAVRAARLYRPARRTAAAARDAGFEVPSADLVTV